MGKGGSKHGKNGGSSGAEKSSSPSLVYRARELFQRVPILGVMCLEALLCQCQSSLLNYLFVSNTQATIVADQDRARFTGVVSQTSRRRSWHLMIFPLIRKHDTNECGSFCPSYGSFIRGSIC